MKQIDTCLLGAATARTEQYTYAVMLRLLTATRPSGNFAATGGAFSSHSYNWNSLIGEASSVTEDGCSQQRSYYYYYYGPQDELGYAGSTCATGGSTANYSYDDNGSVTQYSDGITVRVRFTRL